MPIAFMPLAAFRLAFGPEVMPEITHHFGGGVYAKETQIPAGLALKQHVHAHDHLSILSAGMASVKTGQNVVLYEAPACITIKAGIAHEIFAHSDVTWFCIHATEETDPDKVDEVLIA